MSETDNDKPKLGMRAPLGVRRTVETGKVKQSFSHGRSNTVIVETKKARTFRKPGDPAPTEQVAAPAPAEVEAPAAPAPAAIRRLPAGARVAAPTSSSPRPASPLPHLPLDCPCRSSRHLAGFCLGPRAVNSKTLDP